MVLPVLYLSTLLKKFRKSHKVKFRFDNVTSSVTTTNKIITWQSKDSY